MKTLLFIFILLISSASALRVSIKHNAALQPTSLSSAQTALSQSELDYSLVLAVDADCGQRCSNLENKLVSQIAISDQSHKKITLLKVHPEQYELWKNFYKFTQYPTLLVVDKTGTVTLGLDKLEDTSIVADIIATINN